MFSKATEYALRATIFIAHKGTAEHKLSIDEIAEAIDAPKSFTAKVLQLLTRGNKIVSSIRGPGGGFYLTEKAKQLPVFSILKAMGEDHVLTKCVLGLKQCSEKEPCPMHEQYRDIKKAYILLFEHRTIGSLTEEMDTRYLYVPGKKVKGAGK